MSKKDDFKSFVSAHPNLISIVSSKKKTWQDLFEVYDLYGSNEESWNKYINNIQNNVTTQSSTNLRELTNLFKNINIENVQKYIDTAGKAISVISELTGGAAAGATLASKGPTNPRPINKIFED